MRITEIDKFFGRKEILDLLKKRVLDFKEGYRQNVAFLGGQYVGKSIILDKFISDLDDPDIIPIYLDLENKDLYYFFHKFVGSLLYFYAASQSLPVHEDITLLIESTQKHIPLTVKSIRKIQAALQAGKNAEVYRDIISLPDIFFKETDKFCLIVLDEFHCLEEFGIVKVFQELGTKIMTQKRCLYIVTSSYSEIAKRILSEKLSLLFGDFEIQPINAFNLKTSQEFIAFHLEDLKIGDTLRNFLIDFTGGHPLYLKLICQELVHQCLMHKQNEIFIPLLIQAVENVLFNRWGPLSRHFDLIVSRICSGKGNLVAARILMVLATGKHKLRDLVPKLSARQGLVSQKVNRLIEMDIVCKNGYSYYLRDKLFKQWIKLILHRRRKTIDMDSARQHKQLYDELMKDWESFKRMQHRDLSDRIVELLYCFEEEALHINGRRYKLPLFHEIIPMKVRKQSGGYFHVIKASTSRGQWMIFPHRETIGENDLNAIVSETQRMEQKPQRCILISLSNLDENARIRALQERMWIWNEGELNTLLDLYDKPYIV